MVCSREAAVLVDSFHQTLDGGGIGSSEEGMFLFGTHGDGKMSYFPV